MVYRDHEKTLINEWKILLAVDDFCATKITSRLPLPLLQLKSSQMFLFPGKSWKSKNEHQKCLGWKPNPTLFRHNLTLRKVVKVQDLLIRQLQDLPNWWLGFGALGSERSRAIPNFFNSEMKAAQGFHTFSFYRKHEETASKSHHYKQRACKKSVRLDL